MYGYCATSESQQQDFTFTFTITDVTIVNYGAVARGLGVGAVEPGSREFYLNLVLSYVKMIYLCALVTSMLHG